MLKNIKEKTCYVAFDFEKELLKNEKDLEDQFQLPDGTILTVGKERFTAVEPFFQPLMLSKENSAIHNSIYSSICKSESDLSPSSFSNIVLSGASTLFNGFKERIEKEIRSILDHHFPTEINILSLPNRNFASWIGGSILSSLSNFEKEWISIDQYNEYGPVIVHQKSI